MFFEDFDDDVPLKAVVGSKSPWVSIQESMKWTEEEKQARIEATRKERQRLAIIEEEKKKEHVHSQLYTSARGVIVGFDYNRIVQYASHGLWLDDHHYFVASPEITTPHYMSVAAASSYLFDNLGYETVHTFNKWDGEKLIMLRLVTDYYEESGRAIYVYRNTAVLALIESRAAQLELLDESPKCVAGCIPVIQTRVLNSWTCDSAADGIIVSTATAEYRVKVSRTYDLLVKSSQLTDKEGKTYGPCGRSEGKIVEVNEHFSFIKDRPDKTDPLTTSQVDQVTKSVVIGTMPAVRPSTMTIAYETIVSVAYRAASRLMTQELLWTQDSVTSAIQFTSSYSKEEVYCAVQPFMVVPITGLERREGLLGISREGSKLIFTEPRLRKLTVVDFVEHAARAQSLTQLKKKLINEGWVFTPADFRILRETFFRGYKHNFVLNVGYVAYCYPLIVCQYVQAEGESDLPYIGVSVFNNKIETGPRRFFSPFLGYEVPVKPLRLSELSELPKDVHYSDLLDLAHKTGRAYDETSIGAILQILGKQLIGARPWRLPTIAHLKSLLKKDLSMQELSKLVNVPVPYLMQYIEDHLDIFEFTMIGRVTLRGIVNRIEGT